MHQSTKWRVTLFLSGILILGLAGPSWAAQQWIDVHFHIVGDKGAVGGFTQAGQKAIAIMNRNNIGKAVIMSPPRPFESFDLAELRAVQEKYPKRFIVFGGGGTLNPMIQEYGHAKSVPPEIKAKFEAMAEQMIANGAKGFGEITIHHVSLNEGHGYESIPGDAPLMLLLADIAARHDVPIDLHFDPIPETMKRPADLTSSKNPAQFEENISGFERLLAHNRKTRFIWAHAGSDPVGFYTPALVARMLEKHPNLYCSIRTTYRTNNAMRHPRRGINKNWIEVLEAFPDRFVVGTDSFVITPDYTGPDGPRVFEQQTQNQRDGVNEVLAYIDAGLAKKIAWDNAVRLYRITD